ncbi:MAG: Transcriptional regulator, HxlR family [Frankiales bacterium]|nr:Transcriptional regulator, HxlR family [Frankiales bacterium]
MPSARSRTVTSPSALTGAAESAADARIDPATLPGRPCSIAAAMEIIGEKWALLAVREVVLGNHRFSEIVRNTGAPRDRMAARLKVLVHAGVLERRPYSDAPPRSDYHLTAAGRALAPVLDALLAWGDEWAVSDPPVARFHHDHELRLTSVCRECGEPVRGRDVRREGRLGWDDRGPGSPAV